ncbi:MAG: type I DNA topoisomerase [Patescibacteria group bacterium]
MQLVIVESPTKARKLATYLGSDFRVEASVGHVRDLPKSTLGVDLEHDYEPIYEVSEDKKKVVSQLQKLAMTAEKIFLATDPDREGEAIAWHIRFLLHEKLKKNKKDDHFHRATFHEITKSAVMAAIDNPTRINMDLVNAQQARRVVDRLVGYKLSPVLWKKIRRGLSAGRVQSAALRLIVDREKEIAAFKADEYWEVDVLLNADLKAALGSQKLKVQNDKGVWQFIDELPATMFVARVTESKGKKYEPTKEGDVTDVVSDLQKADYTIKQVESKERRRASLPPFSTSLLQQAAANRLGFSGKQTMTLAQQLYEEGLITYHRTDSFNLSTQAIDMAREYIVKEFGQKYVSDKPRVFATKSKNAQEAHEAIRITDINLMPESIRQHSSRFGETHQRLYDLIRRRFLASQMESAVYDATTITVEAHKASNYYTLKASGSILKFDGWMKLFPNKGDIILPKMEERQELRYVDLNSAQKFTLPPPRYNDASVIKTLEEKGIGRPSTYASIISVIVERGYVERKEKRFFATPVGITVSDFLIENFPHIVDFDFTAEMEEDLDRISRGEKEWKKVVGEFFKPFEKTLIKADKTAERAQIPVEETGEDCPLCAKTDHGKIVIRSGRFGKFRSCSRFPECKFTEAIVETVEGMKCPLCQKGDVVVKNTRWGKPFYGCGRYPDCDWASWGKPDPTLRLTQAQWDIMKKERQERSEKRKATMEAKYGKRPSKAATTPVKKEKKKSVKKKATKTTKQKK